MKDKDKDRLARQIAAQVQRQNNAGIPELLGLSPAQTHQLLHAPLTVNCVVQWQEEISDEAATANPFMENGGLPVGAPVA